MGLIVENLERVREQIAQAASKANRDAGAIEVLAIFEDCDAAKVREAVEAGQKSVRRKVGYRKRA